MVHTLLNFFKKNLGKALLATSLLASSFANAQTGNPIGGYAYLGSCTVNGQPHYYYVSLTQATGPDATAAASALGGGTGYLATLTSQAENDCVWEKYKNYLINGPDLVPGGAPGMGQPTFADSYGDPRNAWIGLNDAGAEGTFTWSNGENCNDFRNWDCGYRPNPSGPPTQVCEPNNVFTPGNSNGEDYVQLLAFAPAGGDPTPGYLGEYGKKNPGKWNDWFNNTPGTNTPETQYYIVEFGPSTCIGDEGCSLGYWKNHVEDWEGFTTNQTLEDVFNVPDALNLDNTNLMSALSFGGGPGVLGGAKNLLRQSVAALLNAASSGVDYPLSVVQVISQVNAALASMDRNTMLTLAATLDQYNNYHGATLCPGERQVTSGRMAPGTMVQSLDKEFAVSGYPNPSRGAFSIQINGASTENVVVKVTDMTGRLIEQRTNVPANQTLQIGNNYKAGMYYVEVIQGAAKKQLKMVKQ